MIRKSIIALSAAAALAFAFAPAAQAKSNVHIRLNVGFGGGYFGIASPRYFYNDCRHVIVKHKKWNRHHTRKIVFFSKKLVCY